MKRLVRPHTSYTTMGSALAIRRIFMVNSFRAPRYYRSRYLKSYPERVFPLKKVWLHNPLPNWIRNKTQSRRKRLTCSPLRFLKSFSLISVILLFCRSSRIVSSGISSGTSFKPDGKHVQLGRIVTKSSDLDKRVFSQLQQTETISSLSMLQHKSSEAASRRFNEFMVARQRCQMTI